MTEIEVKAELKRIAQQVSWLKGDLAWKLPKYTRDVFKELSESKARIFVLDCSRRWRKTTMCCVAALEFAIKHPNSNIQYVCPTAKMVRDSVMPIMRELCQDAPEEVRPKFNTIAAAWTFPNGAQIHISGADKGGADSLRGQAAHIAIVDEAGFIGDLKYLVEVILMPQLLSTKGRLIAASTPPVEAMDHYFFTLFLQAKSSGSSIGPKTILETDYSPDDIEEFAKQAGGKSSVAWRREWLAEFIVDTNRAIIPEFNLNAHVIEFPHPVYFEHLYRYTAIDLGGKDMSAILLGYYDFPTAKLIIQREFILSGPESRTDVIAIQGKALELALWGERQPTSRIVDANNDIIINDLASFHNYPCSKPSKDHLEAMVNELRMWFHQGKIVIDPSCQVLIDTLQFGVWDKARREFQRSPTLGHCDALAALMYMTRRVDTHTNPIPPEYGKTQQQMRWVHMTKAVKEREVNKTYESILNLTPSWRKKKHAN